MADDLKALSGYREVSVTKSKLIYDEIKENSSNEYCKNCSAILERNVVEYMKLL